MSKILSSEIVSLVHHVKLNESGWWEKAIQNIIISIFGIHSNSPLSKDDIFKSLKNEIQTDLDDIRLTKQFEILQAKKKIVGTPDKLFVLSNEVYDDFNISFSNQKKIEIEAEKRFHELCEEPCTGISSNKLWAELNEHLIIPIIKEIGAKTYELLSGKDSMTIDQYGQFHQFILRYNGDKGKVQNLLLKYFDFKNEFVKKYILHQLNAYFFVEATNLNQNTVEQVYNLSKSQTNLKIFIDTNFLLTLLDLHDNPSNDAAFLLLELVDEIKNRVKVKFYVLPITVLEFQNLISKFKDYLKRLNPSLNQAIAAESSEDFSGIIKKYFHKCHEKTMMLDIDDYFDPYLNNFTVNIRKKGIEIQQDNMNKYSSDQRVIDDLLAQVEYRYDRNCKADKYKGFTEEEKIQKKENIYDKFNHDCQMWHYVKDKRPAYIDSTKDVTNWILTLDFSFLEYDKYKQLCEKNNKISICLHPNEFISMLQFWVPRSEKFENAIMSNFRLPFFFKEVDSDSEKVSIEILRAMSQYEDSENFTTELVTEMLTNKALRQKIKPQNSVETNAVLLKEELFKRFEVTSKLLKEETLMKNNLADELTTVKTEISALSQKIDKLQENSNKRIEKELDLFRQSRIQELSNKKEGLRIQKEQLENRIKDFEELITKADQEAFSELSSYGGKIQSLIKGKSKYEKEVKNKSHNRFYNDSKYKKLISDYKLVEKEFNDLIIPTIEEKIIIYCENQNSIYFNKLNFSNIHFVPENNSAGVYIKTISNPTAFGLRDRDYLTDNEIEKLKKEIKNYIILEYYCFENYLYHPENLKELNLPEFDYESYVSDMKNQKKMKYNKIVMNFKHDRNGYQEFKTPDNKFRDRNEEIICDYLSSDEIEIFLKSYSLKKPFFDRTYLEKFQITTDILTSTDWFRKKIEQLLSVEKSTYKL